MITILVIAIVIVIVIIIINKILYECIINSSSDMHNVSSSSSSSSSLHSQRGPPWRRSHTMTSMDRLHPLISRRMTKVLTPEIQPFLPPTTRLMLLILAGKTTDACIDVIRII